MMSLAWSQYDKVVHVLEDDEEDFSSTSTTLGCWIKSR